MTNTKNYTVTGKCSGFGGPDDHGVQPDEGLAIYEQSDLTLEWQYVVPTNPHDLFLTQQPKGTSGLARRLNPDKYYIAMRWDSNRTPRAFLKENQVTVKSQKTGRSFLAWPVDWGPNEATGRVAGLSYGLLADLHITTDDIVEVTVPLPE